MYSLVLATFSKYLQERNKNQAKANPLASNNVRHKVNKLSDQENIFVKSKTRYLLISIIDICATQ